MDRWIVSLACAAALFGCGGDDGSSSGPDSGPGGGVTIPGGDPGFGDGGMATVGFPGDLAAIMRVARQDDGKIVGVGATQESLLIVRVTADGQFDPDFGQDGVVQMPWGIATNGVQVGYGCGIQSDGKIVAAARVLGSYDSLSPREVVVRLLPDGSLDTTFAGTGYVVGMPNTTATALAIDADGNLVVGGYGLERFLPDGTRDSSFGTDGTTTVSGGIIDLAIDAAGNIVTVGGQTIARFTRAGVLDDSFGTGGTVTVGDTSSNQLFSIAVQSDGKIVVGGGVSSGGPQNFWIGRFTSAGAPDTSFATTGAVTGDDAAGGVAYGVGVDASGRIVGSGAAMFNGTLAKSVRFDATGAIDASFGSQGLGTGGPQVPFSNIAFDPDGGFAVGGAGIDNATFGYAIAIGHTTAAGSADPSFGTGGQAVRVVGGSFDRAQAVAFQPDGKLLVGGWAYTGGGAAVARLNHDGTLDTSFGSSGTISHSRNLTYVNALAVQPGGKILVAGLSGVSGTRQFAVERYDQDGTLDPSFGDAGVAGAPIIAGQDSVGLNMAVAADGRIVLVGQTATADSTAVTEYGVLELSPDGVPVADFGTAGAATSNFGGTYDMATQAVIQDDGSTVVLGLATTAPTLVRFTPAGALDPSFGPLALPDSSGMLPFGLVQQDDGALVVVAGNYLDGTMEVVRYSADGVLDDGFGTGGVVSRQFGGNDFYGLYAFMGVAVLPDGHIEIGLAGASDDALTESSVLLRLAADGSADDSAGADGVTTLTTGRGSSSINALAVDADGKLVAVGRTWTETGSSDFMALRFSP